MQEEIEGYKLPDIEEVVIDTNQNKLVDNKSLTPWDMIELTAKQNNIAINKPKDDCRKCFGRGYNGFSEGIPQPCKCIFPKESIAQDKNRIWVNRSVRKYLDDAKIREFSQDKTNKIKDMGLVQIDRNLYKNRKGKKFQWDGNKNFVLAK